MAIWNKVSEATRSFCTGRAFRPFGIGWLGASLLCLSASHISRTAWGDSVGMYDAAFISIMYRVWTTEIGVKSAARL